MSSTTATAAKDGRKQMIGARVERREDYRLLTGNGKFLDAPAAYDSIRF